MSGEPGHHTLVQLTPSATVVSAAPEVLERLRSAFRSQHAACLPRLIEPALLRVIQSRLEHGEFHRRVHPGVGTELCMTADQTVVCLHLLANDPRFLQTIAKFTGCDAIRRFTGRIYRMLPRSDHHDSWHGDTQEESRLIGMSVNLGPEAYAGGLFQLRERTSRRVTFETANTGAGDAIIFRLARHLEHRVGDVTGAVPRTAFAGWFHSRLEPKEFPIVPVTSSARTT